MGDKGILAWDLCRVSNLAQWGYVAGYVTYPEALALIQPAAEKMQKTFSGWDEVYENYLDGYNWWAREDVLDKDVWTVTRGPYMKKLVSGYRDIFDDNMFKETIRGVSGVTAGELAKKLM